MGATGQVILALAGALAGAVLGALVQGAVDGDLRLLESTMAVVCLAVIGATTTLIAVARTSRDVFETQTALTRSSLEEFARNLGLTVRCQMLRDVNGYSAPEEDLVVQAFRQATSEILVLDQLTDRGVRPDVEMNPDVMSWHLDAIIARVARERVRYVRYCQVSDPTRPFALGAAGEAAGQTAGPSAGAAEVAFMRHCLEMCDLRAQGRDISLRISQNVFPYKFVIIDESVLVLQLQELGGELGVDDPRTICELVIHDPRRELIRYFQSMWERVEGRHGSRPLDVRSPEISWLRRRLAAGLGADLA